jgi:hypothetical protein
MADPIADVSKDLGIISVLEKAHETRTSLLLFAFTMFLDLAMVELGGSGLYDLYVNSTALKLNLALEVALIFVFFSLFMSMVMPLIAEVVRQLLIICFHSIWFWWTYDEDHVPSGKRFALDARPAWRIFDHGRVAHGQRRRHLHILPIPRAAVC